MLYLLVLEITKQNNIYLLQIVQEGAYHAIVLCDLTV